MAIQPERERQTEGGENKLLFQPQLNAPLIQNLFEFRRPVLQFICQRKGKQAERLAQSWPVLNAKLLRQVPTKCSRQVHILCHGGFARYGCLAAEKWPQGTPTGTKTKQAIWKFSQLPPFALQSRTLGPDAKSQSRTKLHTLPPANLEENLINHLAYQSR